MPAIIDTNVLIDLFDVGSRWEEWSTRQIEKQRSEGPVVINPIIYAEMAAGFPIESDLDAALAPTQFVREELPWAAAFMAGRAFLTYRQSGGAKRSPLPDFYIGAHATVRGYALVTRDRMRYRQYFPLLRIIAPDTHP